MLRNLKINRFIFLTGLETIILGIYLIVVSNLIVVPPFFSHAQDPIVAVLLVVIGNFSVIVALFNVNAYHARRWALDAMLMIWTLYFIVFIVNDIDEPGPIGLGTIFTGFVIIRLFLELSWGDKT